MAVPAAVMVTERGVPRFGATVSVTVAEPEPDAVEAVIQSGRPVMAHAQPAVAWMVRVGVSPIFAAVNVVGLTEIEQLTGVSMRMASPLLQ